MPGITAQYAKGMVDDMYDYAWEAEGYDKTKTEASDLFQETKKPDGAYYQTTSIIGADKLRKTAETEGYQFRSPVEGFTVLARPFDYTDGRAFTYDAIKDHAKIKNILKEDAAQWGGSKKTTIESFYTDFFNKGGYTAGNEIFNGSVPGVITDASSDVCYDSKPFFNLTGNTRSSKKGATYYNGETLSLSTPNAETLYQLMTVTNAYDENDTKISLRPDIMYVHPSLEFTARRILESTLIPGNNNNDKNVLNAIVRLVVLPHLTTATQWGYGCSKKGLRKIAWQDLTMDFFDDKLNRQWCSVCEMRMLGVVQNWRFWTSSNAPTA